MKDKDPLILQSQYQGCWCPGDSKSQDISSHGIDLVWLVYSSWRSRKIDSQKAVRAQEVSLTILNDVVHPLKCLCKMVKSWRHFKEVLSKFQHSSVPADGQAPLDVDVQKYRQKSGYHRSRNIEFWEKIKEKSEFLDCKDTQLWRLLYHAIWWNFKPWPFYS